MSVPLVCCMRSVCVLCTEMKPDEGEKGKSENTSWLAWTLKHISAQASSVLAGSRGTGLLWSKSHCVLITLMENTWHVFILYLALKQFSNFTQYQRTMSVVREQQKKDAWHAEHCAECLSESFSIAIRHWLCQQVYSCASNDTLNDECMSGIWGTSALSQSEACVRVEFSIRASNMTCHANIRSVCVAHHSKW